MENGVDYDYCKESNRGFVWVCKLEFKCIKVQYIFIGVNILYVEISIYCFIYVIYIVRL